MGIFTYNDTVGLIDIDENINLSKKGLLRILQEAANRASTECGYGISNIEQTGRTWVLLYWRIKLIKNVKYGSSISVKTWAKFSKGLYSNRSFEIYDENNNIIAIADSKWVFVDSVNHSIQKISDDIIKSYGQEDKTLFETELNQRIKFSQKAIKTLDYTVLKRDLDGNHHVNNITFLDLAIDALPNNIKETIFSNVCILFKKELFYKDKVSCFYENIDDEHYIYIYTEETSTLHGVVIFKQ